MTSTPNILYDMHDSRGDPRDMSRAQVARIRTDLLADLYLFAQVVLDFRDLDPALHSDMAALIGSWGTPDHKRLMLQVPRGHLKTSLGTIANALWQISREPDQPVAIFNEKEDNAAMWVRTIRTIIQNSLIFQVLFADLLPPGISVADRERGVSIPRWWKWTDTEINLQLGRDSKPEASIQALGVGSAAAGRHWPKIIMDDLISEDAKNSPSLMAKACEFIDNSLALGDPPINSNFLIICTPWAYGDCYAYALRHYDYKLYRRSAIENGHVIFPAKFNKKSLLALHREKPTHFAAQYMCRPRPGEDQAFEYRWLRWGGMRGDMFEIESESFDPRINPADTPEEPEARVHLSTMEKTLLVDPAPTEASDQRKEPSARSAIVVEGRDYWGRRFLLDIFADRVSPPTLISKVFELVDRWGAPRVAIEKVAFSVLYRHWIMEEANRRGEHITCLDLEPGRRTKDARITAKITPFQQGHYYLSRDVEEAFTGEYLTYPYSETRDILDALAYDDEPGIVPRPMSPVEADQYESQATDWASRYSGIDEITGY